MLLHQPVLPPVKLMQFTDGCCVRKSPISLPLPVTRFTRPAGKPALWNSCERTRTYVHVGVGRLHHTPS